MLAPEALAVPVDIGGSTLQSLLDAGKRRNFQIFEQLAFGLCWHHHIGDSGEIMLQGSKRRERFIYISK